MMVATIAVMVARIGLLMATVAKWGKLTKCSGIHRATGRFSWRSDGGLCGKEVHRMQMLLYTSKSSITKFVFTIV